MIRTTNVAELKETEKQIICSGCKKVCIKKISELNGEFCSKCAGKGFFENSLDTKNCKDCGGYGIFLTEEDKICPDCK